MSNKTQDELLELVGKAVSGDNAALEAVLSGIEDLVFHLSLRMLGTIPDAEDAAQEILIKIMTHLSAFRGESAFTTWAFRIAVNHLNSYKKNMFSRYPLSFEIYGADIASGKEKDIPDLSGGVDAALLEQELKLSCTNVMLQCLDKESRCIFILGTMFKADSRIAGEILGITPQAYRQKLSRIRKRMAAFLNEYCGLSGGGCSCKKRIQYAIKTQRIDPSNLEYSSLEISDQTLMSCKDAMEDIDDIALVFTSLPAYRATPRARKFLDDFLRSDPYTMISSC